MPLSCWPYYYFTFFCLYTLAMTITMIMRIISIIMWVIKNYNWKNKRKIRIIKNDYEDNICSNLYSIIEMIIGIITMIIRIMRIIIRMVLYCTDMPLY